MLGWILDGSWVDFGRFWDQVGRQVEAKLAPKSKKIRYQDDVKKNIKNQESQASPMDSRGVVGHDDTWT